MSNSVGLLIAHLEALSDAGTAPCHRSEGNVEDGAGAWPGLLYVVLPLLFSSNCALFDTYFASKTSSPDSAVPWYNPTTAESVCIVLFACA